MGKRLPGRDLTVTEKSRSADIFHRIGVGGRGEVKNQQDGKVSTLRDVGLAAYSAGGEIFVLEARGGGVGSARTLYFQMQWAKTTKN